MVLQKKHETVSPRCTCNLGRGIVCFMDPIYFMSVEELHAEVKRLRQKVWKAQKQHLPLSNDADELRRIIHAEDGSEQRFQDVFSKRPGWWVIHNILAHTLIGVMPVRPFFRFHDYTARKLRGSKE